MIEAKDKEQAVFHLFRIYGLQSVVHADLRPPAVEESMQTKGRKSGKRKVVCLDDDEISRRPTLRRGRKLREESTADSPGLVELGDVDEDRAAFRNDGSAASSDDDGTNMLHNHLPPDANGDPAQMAMLALNTLAGECDRTTMKNSTANVKAEVVTICEGTCQGLVGPASKPTPTKKRKSNLNEEDQATKPKSLLRRKNSRTKTQML